VAAGLFEPPARRGLHSGREFDVEAADIAFRVGYVQSIPGRALTRTAAGSTPALVNSRRRLETCMQAGSSLRRWVLSPGRVKQRVDGDGAIPIDQQQSQHGPLLRRTQRMSEPSAIICDGPSRPNWRALLAIAAATPSVRRCVKTHVADRVISRAAMRNGRRVWLIAGVAVIATVALVAGVIIGLRLDDRRTAPHPTVPAALAADFARLETELHAEAGIAVSAVGNGQTAITLGQWQSGPAWSTIKVPLVIAALRTEHPPLLTDAMTAAITESDNAAAESIWASLGDPVTAAQKVDAVLRSTGDRTTVQSQSAPGVLRIRPDGWPLTDQVRFISVAVCDTANAPVFALMGRVQSDQGWGIGTVPGSRFKGGWGPSPTGSYLVRQMGVLAGRPE
jgi:hypothetical protein